MDFIEFILVLLITSYIINFIHKFQKYSTFFHTSPPLPYLLVLDKTTTPMALQS